MYKECQTGNKTVCLSVCLCAFSQTVCSVCCFSSSVFCFSPLSWSAVITDPNTHTHTHTHTRLSCWAAVKTFLWQTAAETELKSETQKLFFVLNPKNSVWFLLRQTGNQKRWHSAEQNQNTHISLKSTHTTHMFCKVSKEVTHLQTEPLIYRLNL